MLHPEGPPPACDVVGSELEALVQIPVEQLPQLVLVVHQVHQASVAALLFHLVEDAAPVGEELLR